MKTFDEQIEDVLRQKSEWPGSADFLWENISGQIEMKPEKQSFRRRSFWMGAGAVATIFLAFMLYTMLNTPVLPPVVPEEPQLARMQMFSAIMLTEPEVYLPGEQVELILTSHPVDNWNEGQDLSLTIWKDVEAEQSMVSRSTLPHELIRGQDSAFVQSPMDPGLYRLVVEGSFMDGDQRISVFGEKTIRVEGERFDETSEND